MTNAEAARWAAQVPQPYMRADVLAAGLRRPVARGVHDEADEARGGGAEVGALVGAPERRRAALALFDATVLAEVDAAAFPGRPAHPFVEVALPAIRGVCGLADVGPSAPGQPGGSGGASSARTAAASPAGRRRTTTESAWGVLGDGATISVPRDPTRPPVARSSAPTPDDGPTTSRRRRPGTEEMSIPLSRGQDDRPPGGPARGPTIRRPPSRSPVGSPAPSPGRSPPPSGPCSSRPSWGSPGRRSRRRRTRASAAAALPAGGQPILVVVRSPWSSNNWDDVPRRPEMAVYPDGQFLITKADGRLWGGVLRARRFSTWWTSWRTT